MTADEHQKLKEILHQELEERERAKRPQPMQYWPLVLALVAVVLWEGRQDGRIARNHETTLASGSLSDRLIGMESDLRHLRSDVEHIKGIIEPSNSARK